MTPQKRDTAPRPGAPVEDPDRALAIGEIRELFKKRKLNEFVHFEMQPEYKNAAEALLKLPAHKRDLDINYRKFISGDDRRAIRDYLHYRDLIELRIQQIRERRLADSPASP